MSEPAKPFTSQMKNCFGYLPGQKIGDFMTEIKALTEKDRADFTEMLNAAGYPVSANAAS